MAAPVTLLWIPLGAGTGAGARVVRCNGAAYERLAARWQRRPAAPLFHAALEVRTGAARYAVELAPAAGKRDRGAVRTGPVGLPCAGRSVAFRYELRVWADGVIDDASYVVGAPVDVGATDEQAARLVALAPTMPALTWGRDELGAGDMWNSNSAISWLLSGIGIDALALHPPAGGRAPGWLAGIVAAERSVR